MKWPWWLHWRNPGMDRHGRFRFLLGREPDPAQCVPPDIDSAAAKRAVDLVSEAFGVPAAQRHCLRPEDELLALYRSIHSLGGPDCLEFEMLHILIEQALGRPLAEAEWTGFRSVGDVARVFAGAQTPTPVMQQIPPHTGLLAWLGSLVRWRR